MSRPDPKRKYRYPGTTRKLPEGAPKRLALHSCDTCGKQCFSSRRLAKSVTDRTFPGFQIRFYQCGGLWHFTTVDAGTMGYYRERDTRRAQDAEAND